MTIANRAVGRQRHIPFALLILIAACSPAAPANAPAVSTPLPPTPTLTTPISTPPPVATPGTAATAFSSSSPSILPTVTSEFHADYSSIQSIAFSDAQHGWLLGMPCGIDNCTVMRATRDGGRTWYAMGNPNFPAAEHANGVRNLRLATDQDGWAFGPGLWVTHDAGATWTDQSPQRSDVVDIQVAGGTAWRLDRPGNCPASDSTCIYSLSASSDLGRSWAPLAAQPPIQHARVAMVRRGAQDAWIHAYGTHQASNGDMVPFGGQFLVTHDDGASWQERQDPCTFGWYGDGLSVSPDGKKLWLVCGGQPGAGSQGPKALFTSADDGASWDTTFRTDHSPGYVRGIAAVSEDRAYRGSGRTGGSVLETQDGGQTWQLAFREPQDRDAGIVVLPFADADHGWAIAVSALWRTDDGGSHWERIVP